ncbi:PREDICTED: uncharacterized peptidase C1-like protein F26E4.3, partial [Priapulus caudatus]|uniref:Uncharacterized peptidase C1-like protein F26E4.3 n=1 Tax=Priapulus caudatus TaxID=37621 RepID=A0ABM1DUR0_PRICU
MVTDYKPKMAVLPRWLLAAVVVLVSIVAATATWIPENSDFPYADDVSGDYCRTRVPTCCTDRDDECTVPILDTVCYCDMFCSRDRTDCCPDFYETCQGHTGAVCYDNGKKHFEGTTVKRGCNTCTCKRGRGDEGEWQCGESICLMREDTARDVNAGRYGWRADTYSGSHFSPLTLDEGSSYMLGTKKPDKFISTMVPINYEDLAKQLPTNFDARDKWGEWVGPIRNQELCNASWAFSTTAAASDRLAILSNGTELERLSAQQLLSCNRKNKNPCLDPGALENSWWFMRRTGTVPETCYPFVSGNRENVDKCRFRKSDGSCPSSDNFANNRLYKMTPAYLLSNNTVDIQYEIFSNGPVQAALLVKEDFYVYKSGVYKHTGVTSHLPAD